MPGSAVPFDGSSGISMRPHVVAHADWSINAAKRWIAFAELGNDGRYVAGAPEPAGHPATILARLRKRTGATRVALIGFDFPIGVPVTYAGRVGITDFVALLQLAGGGEWDRFYDVAESAEQISLHRPFYPQRPGGTSQEHLAARLGVPDVRVLLRRCERAHSSRRAAAPLFWTLGGNQVGKAALSGWRDVLAPALSDDPRSVYLWPFDGALRDLLRPGRIVVAETYPTEFYGHLGIKFSVPRAGRKSGKRVQGERRRQAPLLLHWAQEASVLFADELQTQVQDGFGNTSDGEDRFDAAVGLLGMLNVVNGAQPTGEPRDDANLHVEGWILGQTTEPVGGGDTAR